jgi:8-oxo-dGTP pyrophosphatase MutT (NUDIX family)
LSTIKIYIDGLPIFLKGTQQADFAASANEGHPAIYYEKKADIRQALQTIKQHPEIKQLDIYGEVPVREILLQFQNFFNEQIAAGGLVLNRKGKVLMIHRRGYWDLPKGKLDPGETPEQAAIREVNEETSIEGLELGKLLIETFHMFTDRKGEPVLKHVYWYSMSTKVKGKPVPQEEEDITLARWVGKKSLAEKLQNTYPNIIDVFDAAARLPKKLKHLKISS